MNVNLISKNIDRARSTIKREKARSSYKEKYIAAHACNYCLNIFITKHKKLHIFKWNIKKIINSYNLWSKK